MTKLEKGLFENCLERGIVGDKWRLKVTNANTHNKQFSAGDVIEVSFKTYPPKKKKGYLNSVYINIVKK